MKSKVLSIMMAFAVALACASCSSESSNSDNSSGSIQRLYDNPGQTNKSNEFYEKLLDSFLKNHFSKRWKHRSYTPNSVSIVKYNSTDTNTDEIIGTFSFKGRLGIKEYTDREFKATVRDDGGGKYHISFSRREEQYFGAKQGGWETIPSKPFEYTTE